VLRRNPFQIRIPADRAMRVQRVAQSHHPCMEARSASCAPPRVDTKNTQNVIGCGLPARTSRAKLFTDRADHLSDRVLLESSTLALSIGQCVAPGKRP